MADKIKLLFLAANAKDSAPLRLGEEVREIEEKLGYTPHRDSFELISQWAVRPRDLVTALMKYQPTIVHFSGHGKTDGIILEDDNGQVRPVGIEQLLNVFSIFRDSVRLVVLNACYSGTGFEELSKIVDYTVGTTAALSDKAAITFAATFYKALAFGKSVQFAFELAKCEIILEEMSGAEAFSLLIREGVDASESFLTGRAKSRSPRTRVSKRTSKGTEKASEKVVPVREKISQINPIIGNQHNIDIQAIAGFQPSEVGLRSATIAAFSETIPPEIKESLRRFKTDYPEPNKAAFLMMRFGRTQAHENIVAGIKKALDPLGIAVVRADDKQYHDDLFPNVLTYVYGCGFGIAVFERIESEEFNPNVALEVGYMFAIKKHICLLKDKTLRTLQADLVGKLYRVFDPLDAVGTIPKELSQWLADKGLGKTD
jgi:hypothetical protein